LIQKVNRPIFLGMIRLYDDICKQVEVLRQKPPEELSHERFFKILEGFADDIDILLDQQGVTSYRELPTAKFDANRQTAVKTETAPTEEQINDIAKSVLPGFEQGAEILKKERVEVYIKPK
jgi:molecular chaperone GrpE (heat shock protein)